MSLNLSREVISGLGQVKGRRNPGVLFGIRAGKGAIDETDPHYGGVYIGEISLPDVKKAVEESDCILSIGALLSDFNTVYLL